MPVRSTGRLTVTLVPALVAGACYTQAPLPGPEPSAGQEIVVYLTDQGTLDMSPVLGHGVEQVRGVFLDRGAERLQLAVTAVEMTNGLAAPWSRETVHIPESRISEIRQRKLSPSRTAVAAAGALLGVVGLALLADELGAGGGSGGAPPPGTR